MRSSATRRARPGWPANDSDGMLRLGRGFRKPLICLNLSQTCKFSEVVGRKPAAGSIGCADASSAYDRRLETCSPARGRSEKIMARRPAHQSVREQIPPEARRRAKQAGFSADADWYAGRDYVPPNDASTSSGPPERDAALSEARRSFRSKRQAHRRERIREPMRRIQAAASAAGTSFASRAAHLWASLRLAGHRQ